MYLELGRRLGISCHGVGLPGHFLVRLEELGLYLDPFNGGNCFRLLSAPVWRRIPLAPTCPGVRGICPLITSMTSCSGPSIA
jgi:hypothetical protein